MRIYKCHRAIIRVLLNLVLCREQDGSNGARRTSYIRFAGFRGLGFKGQVWLCLVLRIYNPDLA